MGIASKVLHKNVSTIMSNGQRYRFQWWDFVDRVHRHVDGHDYMWALSELLESAQEVIFIMVCCLSSA